MKLVMTLLARDEADIVDAQIAFHLNAGVDFVIATDNLSEDATTEILERYARVGVLHRIDERGDDLRQTEWVTRMAQLAATEFGADWVINADADEFWWPRGASLKDVLASVPRRYGVVRGAWRNFVPRPDDGRFFAERMTVRFTTPSFIDHPLGTHSKSAHRAAPDVRIGRGNHEAFGDGLVPLRGWYPIEILHFPVRSFEQCRRKYVTQFVALEKNAERGIPEHMAEAYRLYLAGRLDDFYEPLVVEDEEVERGVAEGRLAVDTRLREALRALRTEGEGTPFPLPSADGPRLGFPHPSPAHDALFAAESSALEESDFALAIGARIDDIEGRVGRLERGALTRLRGAVQRARRP